jgi:hypothetical protein
MKSDCKTCDAGKWSDTLGAAVSTTCKDCISGKYSPTGGASAIAACIKCAPGKKGTGDVGQTLTRKACQMCAVGYYRPSKNANGVATDANICFECEEGKHQNQEGEASCLACEPGKTQHLKGQSTCNNCPIGRYMSQAYAIASACNGTLYVILYLYVL